MSCISPDIIKAGDQDKTETLNARDETKTLALRANTRHWYVTRCCFFSRLDRDSKVHVILTAVP